MAAVGSFTRGTMAAEVALGGRGVRGTIREQSWGGGSNFSSSSGGGDFSSSTFGATSRAPAGAGGQRWACASGGSQRPSTGTVLLAVEPPQLPSGNRPGKARGKIPSKNLRGTKPSRGTRESSRRQACSPWKGSGNFLGAAAGAGGVRARRRAANRPVNFQRTGAAAVSGPLGPSSGRTGASVAKPRRPMAPARG